jgi:hypothetical protein
MPGPVRTIGCPLPALQPARIRRADQDGGRRRSSSLLGPKGVVTGGCPHRSDDGGQLWRIAMLCCPGGATPSGRSPGRSVDRPEAHRTTRSGAVSAAALTPRSPTITADSRAASDRPTSPSVIASSARWAVPIPFIRARAGTGSLVMNRGVACQPGLSLVVVQPGSAGYRCRALGLWVMTGCRPAVRCWRCLRRWRGRVAATAVR